MGLTLGSLAVRDRPAGRYSREAVDDWSQNRSDSHAKMSASLEFVPEKEDFE